jgi:2-polyprenyl-3-methyl-5-hydroxy-6-metoxy-1,4-benzoquinol methylase
MDETYWDTMSADYDGQIFSCLDQDRDSVIVSAINRFADEALTACDFGCGVGKFLPVLSQNFARVYAVDISDKLLQQARLDCRALENVTYLKKDLSKSCLNHKKIDFAFSVNVAIMPCSRMRIGIFNTICTSLRKGGRLLLVVPSLESALYADFQLVQWNQKAGLEQADATEELHSEVAGDTAMLRQGIIDIDGLPTKHYLEEELIAMFRERGFDITSLEKVRYSWDTEFDQPPRWMKAPYPWDWLLTCKKQ